MLRNGEKRIMGRLTRRVEEDGIKAVYINEKSGEDFECFLENEYGYKTVDKLAAYEDIIDDPEKLKEFDAVYLDRCKEINKLRNELEKTKRETKNKIVDILAEEAYLQFREFEVKHGYPTVNDCMDIIENIVKKFVGV